VLRILLPPFSHSPLLGASPLDISCQLHPCRNYRRTNSLGALRIVTYASRGTGLPLNLRIDLCFVMNFNMSSLMCFVALTCEAYSLQQDALQRQRLAAEDYRCVWKGRSWLAHCGTTAICLHHAGLEFTRFRPDCHRIPTTNCLSSRRLALTSGTDSRDLSTLAICRFPIINNRHKSPATLQC